MTSLSRFANPLVFALFLGLAQAQAQTPATQPYASISTLELSTLLPPPPAQGSPAYQTEVDAILAAQQSASPARVKQAVADAKGSVFDMFGQMLGPRFTAPELPATAKLFNRLGDSETAVVGPAQKAFGRTRPFTADSRVQVISGAIMMPTAAASAGGDALTQSGSWPSGRATRVSASAIILAAMLPEQRAAIWGRATEYAQSRVIAGMHYPQDLEAGYRAGTALAAALLNDGEFQTEFAAARQEVRAALGR